jgi:hypothetical protein
VQKSLTSLYDDYIFSQLKDSNKKELFEQFWGETPKRIGNIQDFLLNKKISDRGSDNSTLDEQELLYDAIYNFHKKNNLLAPQTKILFNNWFETVGSVECGHQPIYFGGSSFLFNKLTYTSYLSSILSPKVPLTPIFFLGDHDEIQNELTISRAPQAYSQSGLEIKSDYNNEFILTPMYKLPKPDDKLFLNHLEKVKQNYRELMKFSKINPQSRPLLESRLEESLGIIYESYYKSGSSFSDWITQLLGDILIYKNKLPILMVSGSNKELRKLILPYLEYLSVRTIMCLFS